MSYYEMLQRIYKVSPEWLDHYFSKLGINKRTLLYWKSGKSKPLKWVGLLIEKDIRRRLKDETKEQ